MDGGWYLSMEMSSFAGSWAKSFPEEAELQVSWSEAQPSKERCVSDRREADRASEAWQGLTDDSILLSALTGAERNNLSLWEICRLL